MAKRTSRVAWILSGLLTVALVSGLGTMLHQGVTVGNLEIRARLTDRWTTGTGHIFSCGPGNNSASTSVLNLGFLAVDMMRLYHGR
jgi:hypothetical protein